MMRVLDRIKERLAKAAGYERCYAGQFARNGDLASMRRASRCEGKAEGLEEALRIIEEEKGTGHGR